MALGVLIKERRPRGRARGWRRWALTALALTSASCVPVSLSQAPPAPALAPPPVLAATDATPIPAPAALAALPTAGETPLAYEGRTALDRLRSLDCLAQAIYYEAGSESEDGQRAVAQVVLNRVRHPAFQPSVCGVVFQGYARKTGCQFTFTCDGSLLRTPNRRLWDHAHQVAAAALGGAVFKPVGLATHYHANYVVPYWATSLEKNAQVGAHIFYRWPDAWGMPAAFARKYLGNELDPASLRSAAIMNEVDWASGAIPPDDGIQLSADPRMELLAVVQLLANGNSDLAQADVRYTKDAKAYFAPEADHQAVQLFRKLDKSNADFAEIMARRLLGYSSPPELAPNKDDGAAVNDKNVAELVDALRDFARSSEFTSFFAGHKPFYASVIRRSEHDAAMSRAYWTAYTGMPLPDRKLILSSLAKTGGDKCASTWSASVPGSLLSLGSLAQTSGAETFLSTEGTQVGLDKPAAGKAVGSQPTAPSFKLEDPALQQQVIRAVFTRIAALSKGNAAGQSAVEREVRQGFAMVTTLDARLRYYEAHRDQFATLADFLPQLVAGMGKAPAKADATAAESKAAQCGIQIAVASPESLGAPSGGQ